MTMPDISSTAVCDDELADPVERAQAAELAELFEALGDPTRLRVRSALDTACVWARPLPRGRGLR